MHLCLLIKGFTLFIATEVAGLFFRLFSFYSQCMNECVFKVNMINIWDLE